MTRKLKIGSWNVCNGLASKLDYVRTAIMEYDLDILMVQETELPVDCPENIYYVQGYKTELSVISSGCKTRMICYIRENVNYQRCLEASDCNLILLRLDKSYSVQKLIGGYRAYQIVGEISLSERTKKMVEEITDFMEDEQTCIILGDMNLDYKKKNSADY